MFAAIALVLLAAAGAQGRWPMEHRLEPRDASNTTFQQAIPDRIGRQGCQIISGNICYPDLHVAVGHVAGGSVIIVYGSVVVTQQSNVEKDITVNGEVGAVIVANLKPTTDPAGATIFRAVAAGVKLTLNNIHFVNQGEYGSVFRTQEMGTEEFMVDNDLGPVGLSVKGCTFEGFRTGLRGGSVFFIGRVGRIEIAQSVFRNNTVSFKEPLMYEGGGTIWVVWADGPISITESHFQYNSNKFGHGIGGCLGINNATSTITLTGNSFINNTANGGGVLYVGFLLETATLKIHSHFVGNIAQDNGWARGCRGGVAWLQQIYGHVESNGIYEENYSLGDRGAVFANNRLFGTVALLGHYRNNHAAKGGSVWDTHYHAGGVVTGNMTDVGNSAPSLKMNIDRPYVPDESMDSTATFSTGMGITETILTTDASSTTMDVVPMTDVSGQLVTSTDILSNQTQPSTDMPTDSMTIIDTMTEQPSSLTDVSPESRQTSPSTTGVSLTSTETPTAVLPTIGPTTEQPLSVTGYPPESHSITDQILTSTSVQLIAPTDQPSTGPLLSDTVSATLPQTSPSSESVPVVTHFLTETIVITLPYSTEQTLIPTSEPIIVPTPTLANSMEDYLATTFVTVFETLTIPVVGVRHTKTGAAPQPSTANRTTTTDSRGTQITSSTTGQLSMSTSATVRASASRTSKSETVIVTSASLTRTADLMTATATSIRSTRT